MSFDEGDSVQVEFAGVVETGPYEAHSTSRVRENGSARVHYLFLEDRAGLGLTDPRTGRSIGDEVHVSFTGRLRRQFPGQPRAEDVPRAEDGSACRAVIGGTGSYIHFVDLSSPNVWPAGPGFKARKTAPGDQPEPGGERIIWRRVS